MTDQLPFDAIVLPPSWAPGHSRAIAALDAIGVHAAETAETEITPVERLDEAPGHARG